MFPERHVSGAWRQHPIPPFRMFPQQLDAGGCPTIIVTIHRWTSVQESSHPCPLKAIYAKWSFMVSEGPQWIVDELRNPSLFLAWSYCLPRMLLFPSTFSTPCIILVRNLSHISQLGCISFLKMSTGKGFHPFARVQLCYGFFLVGQPEPRPVFQVRFHHRACKKVNIMASLFSALFTNLP